MRRIRSRRAARPLLADQEATGEVEGFTFVEIIVAVLIVGIFAAIVVFSVATVTHRGADPKCTDEVTQVQLAIRTYRIRNNNTNPASLDVLVKQKLLPQVPSLTTPSGKAGYAYDPINGTYGGGKCPSR